ncbi:hypothetical protein NHH03_19960 [Stieleria sp. TO1_6]|nr:hypothetical protein [Stieleria tagensis]
MSSNQKTQPNQHPNALIRDDSALSWMVRGLLLGVLIIGTANALSFFFRSQGWGGLLGKLDPHDEAIGFPLTIWRESGGYGAHHLNVLPFIVCLALAVVLGSIAGVIAIANRHTLNQIMTRLVSQSHHDLKIQFSLRGLLIATVLAALAAAIVKTLTPRVELLAGIYALGPIALIAIAFIPRQLNWQQRVAILTPLTFVMIAIAITLGIRLGIEFDKVLMGIFICWTPQTAIAAVALSGWIMIREYRALPDHAAKLGEPLDLDHPL